jgi:hypothetical protein
MVTAFPINAEIPSLTSPAVTNGKIPEILSALFSRLPRVDFPNNSSRLNSPHSTFSNLLLSRVSTFPHHLFD